MPRLLVMADGRSIHTERWCRFFESAGYETALFSLEPIAITPPRTAFQGKRPTSIGTIDYWLARGHFRKILDSFAPDIINPHYVVSYGWLAAQSAGIPIVATAWGSDLLLLPQKSAIHRKRIAHALRTAACCTVDNRNLADAAAAFMPREKILSVIMGIEQDVFAALSQFDVAPGKKLGIIAPRGLQTVYDPQTIIDAAVAINDSNTMSFDMYGAGDRYHEFMQQLTEHDLPPYIALHPFLPHDEYTGILKNYDVYVSASLSDSTSVALLEAMSAGLFPVVSDIAGNREWISDGDNGLLFETGSATALAGALKRAESMKASFAEIAKANRRMVAERAIWEDNLERLLTCFRELIA